MIKQCFIGLAILVTACNKWEDHTAITDDKLNRNLFQQISADPELSRFAGLLTRSGFDKVIASSQNYTVFAPTNKALATLDATVENDSGKLRLFVGNHITNQLLPGGSSNRVPMLNGKYNNLDGARFDEATIGSSAYTKNGWVHSIDKMVPGLNNAWEFLQSDVSGHQSHFMRNNKDSVGNNVFLTNVQDLRDEQKQFTFFVLADTAWDKEVEKYKPFFKTGTNDSTANAAQQAIANDLAVEGVLLPNAIPDTMLSKFNTKLGIDKSAILRTVKVSNGIVYIMSRLEVLPKHKFLPYIIQGENYHFARVDRRNQTYFRDKYNKVTGKDFRDVLVFDHGIAEFHLGYRLYNVPSLRFKAYWVAVNDNINNNTAPYRQLLGIGTPTSNKLPYTTVSPDVFDEVLLGEFNQETFRPVLNLYLTADNTTNRETNKITVDYIKLEPVL